MIRKVDVFERALQRTSADAQRLCNQPRDMSPEARQKRIEAAAAKAEASSRSYISKDTSFKGDS